jgi:hypothetical protein
VAIKKLVKVDHKDPLFREQLRHHEDVFNSVNLALQPSSLLAATTASLDDRYTSISTSDGRYVFTSSYGQYTASLNSFTGSVKAFSASMLAFTASADSRYVLTSSTASQRISSSVAILGKVGIGVSASSTIPLVVSSSNFTSVYVVSSGTRAVLELNAATTGNQAALQFDDVGNQAYLMGKQTDNSFFLFDAINNRSPFVYQPWEKSVVLNREGGNVGVGINYGGFPSTNFEVASGSANGSVGIKVSNTSSVNCSAFINLNTGIRSWTLTSDQNGNFAFNDDSGGGNRGYWRASDGMFLVNNSAYVGTNLGVGTSSPSQKLHVLGGDALVSHGVNNGSAFLQIYNSSSLSSSAYLDLNTGLHNYRVYSNPTADFGIYDNTIGAYRMKIDDTGRFGVGATDPTVFMHIQGDTLIAGSASVLAASPSLAIKSTTPAASFPTAYLELSSALKTWRLYNNSSAEFGIFDATPGIGAYRFKIDSAGQVGIGTTPSDLFHVNGIMRSQGNRCCQGTAGSPTSNTFNVYWTGAAAQLWIDTTNVGTITLTSDRRLKQMIRTVTGSALEAIGKLRPVAYRWQNTGIWRDDGHDHLGFLADELQQVIPSAVNGAPSGSDFQSLNYGDIIAVQAKAIQELSASNATMAAQITSLQASLSALSGTVVSLLKPNKP